MWTQAIIEEISVSWFFITVELKKSIPHDVSGIWIQMYRLMYMTMDCEWFKHRDHLTKFVSFLAMYGYYSDIVDMRALGDHIVELSTVVEGAVLAQDGCPEIELSMSFWKYKHEWDSFGDTQLVFGPNEICVWHRQTSSCSPFSHGASDPKAHRSALESKGSYWKPLEEFFF